MNVWQTLEFLSGINLRKRYHYEGYSDTENIIRTLTPSWRRDSYAEKAAAANKEENGGAGGTSGAAGGTGSGGRGKAPVDNVDTDFMANGATAMRRDQTGSSSNGKGVRNVATVKAKKSGKRSSTGQVRFARDKSGKSGGSKQQQRRAKSVTQDAQYVMLPAEYTDLVKCKYELQYEREMLEFLFLRKIYLNLIIIIDFLVSQ